MCVYINVQPFVDWGVESFRLSMRRRYNIPQPTAYVQSVFKSLTTAITSS